MRTFLKCVSGTFIALLSITELAQLNSHLSQTFSETHDSQISYSQIYLSHRGSGRLEAAAKTTDVVPYRGSGRLNLIQNPTLTVALQQKNVIPYRGSGRLEII